VGKTKTSTTPATTETAEVTEATERPYFRTSGEELVKLIEQSDTAAIAEGVNRKAKQVQEALAKLNGETSEVQTEVTEDVVIDEQQLATITPIGG
jgi:gas vesicle protein